MRDHTEDAPDDEPEDQEPEDDDLPILEEVEDEPPGPGIALLVKRAIQVLTFGCALTYFLLKAQMLPALPAWVEQYLFAGVMIGLVATIGASMVVRFNQQQAKAARPRLRLK